jgi:small-conductance mechanosensitive channel
MVLWLRLVVLGAVVLGSLVLAKLIDLQMARRKLAPGAETRYRVLRRSLMTGIVVVGVLSGLLVLPQVRAVAGGILASGAILGVIIGFASQRTLANFAAGLLIAFTQPLRLGDRVAVDGAEGTVEEIALTYTFIRTDENVRLVIPNEKLASDTIRNSTIVNRETLAQITVLVPLDTDLAAAVDGLRARLQSPRAAEVFVGELGDRATVVVQAWVSDEASREKIEAELRLEAHAALRELGVWERV